MRAVLVVAAVALCVAGCSSSTHRQGESPAPSLSTTTSVSSAPSSSHSSSTAPSATPSASSTHATPHHATPRPSPPSAAQLPLGYSTGSATQIITVTTSVASNTHATLQSWTRQGSGWQRIGPSVAANLGTDGMTARPSETLSATPEGSYTLTQAFGREADPGTALPYRQTTPADWWISQSGPLYNTLQHCAAQCAFTLGEPNEHLYDMTPFYNFAVVIDYNTANSPTGVRQGAGSAFFLHVSDGAPTAGCVSIPSDQLVRIMRWLRPAAHPRILIGIA